MVPQSGRKRHSAPKQVGLGDFSRGAFGCLKDFKRYDLKAGFWYGLGGMFLIDLKRGFLVLGVFSRVV